MALLAHHTRRLSFGANGHIQFSVLEHFTILFFIHIEPGGEGQLVPLFQFLGRLYGRENVVLAMPKSTVQTDAAGHDVDVVVVGVAMALHVIEKNGGVHAHFTHEIGAQFVPLLG